MYNYYNILLIYKVIYSNVYHTTQGSTSWKVYATIAWRMSSQKILPCVERKRITQGSTSWKIYATLVPQLPRSGT